jgi:DNA-directed RNA polymerase specialized sigma subunit
VNRTIPSSCSFVDKNEVLEEKDFYIYTAVLKYDPSYNTKFSTHLANETRWRCLNLYNKNKKFQKEPLEDQLKDIEDPNFFLDQVLIQEDALKLSKITEKQKDKRIKKIIDMRYGLCYNDSHSWREIAEVLNISVQGCIDIHDKFLKKLKKELKNV